MPDPVDASATQVATELPAKYLPAAEYRDLPEPRGLRTYVGASVIISATALGSGELILWPSIASQVGLTLAWLAVLGITMQYFLNMEIERYTLVTGETAVTGFTRLWLPWGFIFVLGAILPNVWPGWAASGATEFTFIFGLSPSTVPIVATIFLVSIGLAVTISPVIYQTVEKAEGVMLVLILVFIVAAIALATTTGAWAQVITSIPRGVTHLPAYLGELGAASLFGAVVFAGAGGANNLVQSNYIKDKGMGMGINLPNIVSPITGDEVSVASLGYVPRSTEENARRWRVWWRIANQEQLVTFWFIGALFLVGLSVLAYTTVPVGSDVGEGLDFVKAEGTTFAHTIGPWFEMSFYIAGFLMLFSTNIGVMDYVSRLTGDSLKVTFLKRSGYWSESKIYVATVWLLIVVGSLIVWSGIEPVILLVISASGGGFVMAFYSVLLIVLNRRAMPRFARLTGWRLPVMVLIATFYIAFAIFLIYQMVAHGPASVT